MHKLLSHLLKSGRKDALNSIDELTNAATDLGYSAHEIEEALEELGMIALNEDLLSAVTGGASDIYIKDETNISYKMNNSSFNNTSLNNTFTDNSRNTNSDKVTYESGSYYNRTF